MSLCSCRVGLSTPGSRFFSKLGDAIPGLNEKCAEAKGKDRPIFGWMVYSDDMVVPFRRSR